MVTCPRCNKANSYELRFNFKEPKVYLDARVCKVCEYLWAEDEELLKTARKHLKWLGAQNGPGSKPN